MELETKLRIPIYVAPHHSGGAGHSARHARRSLMRNYETTAFGTVALVAQVLVVAAIFVAG
jgi:hypothetical protein